MNELRTQEQRQPATNDETRALTPRVDVLEDDAGLTLLEDLRGPPLFLFDFLAAVPRALWQSWVRPDAD